MVSLELPKDLGSLALVSGNDIGELFAVGIRFPSRMPRSPRA